ncbi:hypothetical protein OIU78_029396 [Salix suchowensis]|nr:hypothetical protein OIU78_029396 [Salix suchowensis]
MVLLAHVALGFSSKQSELINKAKTICECLIASEGIDLKFEEAFCLFLLGQGNQDQAVEKLQQIQSNSNLAARNLVPGKEIKDVSSAKPSLETWLKDSVLVVFSDTRDCSPSLVNFFGGEKRVIGSKKSRVPAQAASTLSRRPLSDIAMKRMDSGESHPYTNSSQHFRSAVKQLSPTDLQSSLILTENGSGSNCNEPSVQLKREIGAHNRRAWESWLQHADVARKISCVAVLGCFFVFITFKLSGTGSRRRIVASNLISDRTSISTSSLAWKTDSFLDHNVHPVHIRGSGIAERMRKLLSMLKMQYGNRLDDKTLQSSRLASSISPSMATVSRNTNACGRS